MSDTFVIVNMGGPADLEGIPDYLRKIFQDPFILPMPRWLRRIVAELILKARLNTVTDRYRQIGGTSPLLQWTEQLRSELEKVLRDNGNNAQMYHAYRYSTPTLEETIKALSAQNIRRFTLIPLFPHYTRAMTGSIVHEARRVAGNYGIRIQVTGAWGLSPPVVDLWHTYLISGLEQAGKNARVLFVAHGIPQRNVTKGEDYPLQVQKCAEAVARALPVTTPWSVAFQSHLGPVRWTEPYIEQEMNRLCRSTDPIVIMPLSFVSDCLETLCDLDTVAVKFARERGITKVVRVPAFNDDPCFAQALYQWIEQEVHQTDGQ